MQRRSCRAGATIAADGRLRSRYKYISQMRAMRDSIDAKAAEGGDLAALDAAGSTVLRLDGGFELGDLKPDSRRGAHGAHGASRQPKPRAPP